jgi:hypothetical protein
MHPNLVHSVPCEDAPDWCARGAAKALHDTCQRIDENSGIDIDEAICWTFPGCRLVVARLDRQNTGCRLVVAMITEKGLMPP